MQNQDGGTSVGGVSGQPQVTCANDDSRNDPLPDMDEGPFIGKSGQGDGTQKMPFRDTATEQEKEHFSDNDIGADGHFSQVNSFTSNIITNWDSLSKTSQESILSEATRLLLEEKDKRIKNLEEHCAKLAEKIELKENEVSKLKVDLGSTNILLKQLKEKEEEIKKLNTELHEAKKGSPVNLHK